MTTFLQLVAVGLLPTAVSVILYIIDKNTAFGKMKYVPKQIVLGLIFGLLAVCATEFGVDMGGAIVNVRDSAPICAGLIFGAPAGIISGVIGGVERWFSTLWGGGEYTRLACTVATILAGLFAAACRKYMFDNKKPTWYFGLAIGMITEVIHMLMIFLTNMSDVHHAFSFVQFCSIPMISLNSLSVMLAVLLISILGNSTPKKHHELKKIAQTFQRWLLVCLVVGFLCTTLFSWVLQTQLSESDAENLISLNLADVKQDISDASDKNLLSVTREVAEEINVTGVSDSESLKDIAEMFDVAEINIIDQRGVVSASTYDGFVNYNMNGGKQSAEFLVLLDGKTNEYVQSYQPTSSNSNIWRKYAGVVLERGGFVQVAYDAEHFQKDIDEQVLGATKNRHIGEDGFIIIADEDRKIVSSRSDGESIIRDFSGIKYDRDSVVKGQRADCEISGRQYFMMYTTTEGYYIIAFMPVDEAVFSRDVSVNVTVFMEFIIFGMLFVLVYVLIKKLVVDNIDRVNDSLAQITNGDLNVVVDVRSNSEFASLSDDINSTVVTLKRYIAEAAARIDKELEFARQIQHSALPSVFPPFPNKTEFEIFASMDTAKEVGGDFYDFYFVGEDKLAFLIADVSGKGIPAAMFMMTSKTLLKSFAETGCEVNEVFTSANAKLCENNDAAMFVTAWMGVLDIKTGLVEFANAGHNPPLIRHKDGSFEYLKSRAGFVLAGMEGLKYRKNELQLGEGDEVFLYTDGVTEATNSENELYGEERLLNFMNTLYDLPAEAVCNAVKADVDAFVGEAPQFDDITMVYLKYNGAEQKGEQDG
ncbi:MAG: SpoIIE family protein phosphatase [[Eubacterium] saphenum]|nr:SpoIIE family protein phosphatase [[Eubacterium] saphenum]